jgi:hypothetical protein
MKKTRRGKKKILFTGNVCAYLTCRLMGDLDCDDLDCDPALLSYVSVLSPMVVCWLAALFAIEAGSA